MIKSKTIPNAALRYKIAEMVHHAGEGHIPSYYSILEILSVLYGKFLRFRPKNPDWSGRDYFILSKGHGSGALYVILEKFGFLTRHDLESKSQFGGILGGHPDSTKIPGVETSTGSLGHGVVTALGIALGLRIKKLTNRVIALIGDAESNEGTVWEMALVAANLRLGNLLVIMDYNKSTDQILKMPHMKRKWQSFGWQVDEVDGHDEAALYQKLKKINFDFIGRPKIIIAHTIKGKGVSFTEGHGIWHHKIPTQAELELIKSELKLS